MEKSRNLFRKMIITKLFILGYACSLIIKIFSYFDTLLYNDLSMLLIKKISSRLCFTILFSLFIIIPLCFSKLELVYWDRQSLWKMCYCQQEDINELYDWCYSGLDSISGPFNPFSCPSCQNPLDLSLFVSKHLG